MSDSLTGFNVAAGPMSPTDLLGSNVDMGNIKNYMTRRFGIDGVTNKTNPQILDMYMSQMRGFAAGQSVVTLGELNFINSGTKADKQAAGNAYKTFDKLGNVFGQQNTRGEKFKGLYDYTRAAIVDPINILSLGTGKILAAGGAKAASVLVKAVAQKALSTALEKGASEGAARVVQQKVVQSFVKSATYKQALKAEMSKEVLATTAVDTVSSFGLDYAYQSGMIKVGNQDSYSVAQGGIAALGGLVAGGISLAGNARRLSGVEKANPLGLISDRLPGTDAASQAKKVDTANVAKDLSNLMKTLGDNPSVIEPFSNKVARGSSEINRYRKHLRINSNDDRFWKYFILGNDQAGVKGLAETMFDSGLKWYGKRGPDDNITNFMMDTLKAMPAKEKDQIISSFKKHVGPLLDDYKKRFKGKDEMSALADLIASKASGAGTFLNILSQASKRLGKKVEGLTVADTMSEVLDPASWTTKMLGGKPLLEKAGYMQQLYIRMLISHPGTTALNIKGWIVRSGMQSMADIIQAGLYSGRAMAELLVPGRNPMDSLNKAGQLLRMQKQKIINGLNPYTTKEAFMSYLSTNKKASDELLRYINGGVDNKALQSGNRFIKAIENGVEHVQTAYAVKAQDIVSKSQEFMYHIDKQIRLEYNQTYSEFLNRPDLAQVTNSEKYTRLEFKALEDTQRAVFSKSYKPPTGEAFNKSPIAHVAGIVEDLRNVVGLGTIVPFGRFFNNTIALMSDFSGVTLALKPFAEGLTGKKGLRDSGELLAIAAAGWTSVGLLMSSEKKTRDEGLAWYEQRNSDGSVVSKLYDFPYSAIKMSARMLTYTKDNQAIPKDLITDAGLTFGPQAMTREMSRSAKGFVNIVQGLASGDLTGTANKIMSGIPSQYASGYTRFLDPINQMAGLALGNKNKELDRKQGRAGVLNAIRYVDKVGALLIGDFGKAKTSALRARVIPPNPARAVSYREVPAHSFSERLFNMMGKPQWRVGIYSGVPEADSLLRQTFFPILEKKAKGLLLSKRFQSLDTIQKGKLGNLIISQTMQETKDTLKNSPVLRDRKMELMYSISNKRTERDINYAKKKLGITKDLKDMSTAELETLDTYIADIVKTAKFNTSN